MSILDPIEQELLALSAKIPLTIFSPLAALIEEVVAPIPSPIVMAVTGSVAEAQGMGWTGLIWLSFLGAIGKTIGAMILYVIADKAEDWIFGNFGKFLGITHKELEDIGKHFTGSWKDGLLVFLGRAIPIMPSAPVSVISGIVKIDLKSYIPATFLGSFVRNIQYIYLGYAGLRTYESLLHGLDTAESMMQILLLGMVLGVVAWAYYTRHKKKDVIAWIKEKLNRS